MKKSFSLLIAFSMVIISCNTVKNSAEKSSSIEGVWELQSMEESIVPFEELFLNKKPTIIFDLKQNRISGNNSCNSYSGNLKLDGVKINLEDTKMAMTMMACPGKGEGIYMKSLEKVDTYSISVDGKILSFMNAGKVLMRYGKK